MNRTKEDSPLKQIEPKLLEEMAAANMVRGAVIRMAEGKAALEVVLDLGSEKRLFGKARNMGPRYFQTFDGAVSSLMERGVTQFMADAKGWTPKTEPKWLARKGKKGVASA